MTQELAATPDNAVAVRSEEELQAMQELAQGSGEMDQGGSYLKIPYITVDNKMVKETIPGKDGKPDREVSVRCEPNFVINEKVEDKYEVTLFAPEFDAIILKFKHRVQRRYLQDQSTPPKCTNKMAFWRSLEFNDFRSKIYVRQEGNFLPPMDYGQVKAWAQDGDENELWGIAYILIKGEETVRKVEFKGASRSVLFDYMTTKRDFHVSNVYTKFSLEVVSDTGSPYNKLVLTKLSDPIDSFVALSKMQKELNVMLDNQSVPSAKAEEGEVIEARGITGKDASNVDFGESDDTEVEGIPFN